MKKFTSIFLLTCLYNTFSFSQITFQKEYGWDSTNYYASDLIQTMDGGYLMTGVNFVYAPPPFFPPIEQLYDGSYIVKTDAYGDTIWTRHFAEALYGALFKVFELADSSIVLLGNKNASYLCNGVGVSYPPYQDLVFLQLDYNGNYLNFAQYINDCDEQLIDAIKTLDGGFAILGMHEENGPSGTFRNPVLYKIDGTASLQWVQNYSDSYYSVHSILQYADSNYFITGNGLVSGFDYDANFIQTNPAGDTLSCVYITDTTFQTGWKLIEVDSAGNFLIMAREGSWQVNYVPRTSFYKIDSLGNIIWIKKHQFIGNDIILQPDGGFLVTGTELSQSYYDSLNVFVVKLNANSDSLWSKNYGGIKRDISASICSTSDGGFAVLGTKDAFNYNPNGSRYFLVKDTLLTTNITELHSNYFNISISPNPTPDFIYFNKENLTAEIFDLTGRKLLHQKIKDKQLNISNFLDGIYFLKVHNGNAVRTFKIIKH